MSTSDKLLVFLVSFAVILLTSLINIIIIIYSNIFILGFTVFFTVPLGAFIISYSSVFLVSATLRSIGFIYMIKMRTINGILLGLFNMIFAYIFMYLEFWDGKSSFIAFIGNSARSETILHLDFLHASGDFNIGSKPLLGWLSLVVQPFGAVLAGIIPSKGDI